jgi:hypothetical protein
MLILGIEERFGVIAHGGPGGVIQLLCLPSAALGADRRRFTLVIALF